MKLVIANDMNSYWQGKCDGIQFLNVTEEDCDTLKQLAIKYKKQFYISASIQTVKNDSGEQVVITDNTKSKQPEVHKIWVHNEKGNKLIMEQDLQQYEEKGYILGRKK